MAGLSFKKNKNTTASEGGNVLKRRRENSGGDAVVTQTGYTVPPKLTAAAKSTAAPPGADKAPKSWRRLFEEAEDNGNPVPPPTAIRELAEIRETVLRDFRAAQLQVQKAVATNDKFRVTSSTGIIPSVISNTLKLPALQFLKGAEGVVTVPEVADAKATAEKDIATAAASSVKYVSAVYSAQIGAMQSLAHVATVANGFATSIKVYGNSVIQDGGGLDLTIWDSLFVKLKSYLETELQSLNFEFVAALKHEARIKDAKALALSSAKATAEMTDATKPVKELISENGDSSRRK
ncbi:hypothetical protein B0H14DRAFT_2595947 [Mycena olivaceomarginata]|nr:hypothetical protein B0H14DRAFT_2595947 [Mycena olivaceomarginata]